MLAKALAHFFEAKLLLLDVTDFSLKVSLLNSIIFFCKSFLICYIHNWEGLFCFWLQIQSKYGGTNKESVCLP